MEMELGQVSFTINPMDSRVVAKSLVEGREVGLIVCVSHFH